LLKILEWLYGLAPLRVQVGLRHSLLASVRFDPRRSLRDLG
jgi:hypothetical protein